MARAHEHLASARYAEAAGAFRAVLRIDPNEFQAHFGLADALVARGQRAEAVEGLVAAAESCTAREDNGAALTLYGKALSVDPMRLELHLDVAMAEAALGRMDAAQSRLEHLAEVYMQAGRTDEAAEVYRCIAGWEADGEEAEAEAEPEAAPVAPQRTTEVPASTPAQAPRRDAVPMAVGTSETVVISTILITPDGQLFQMPIEQQAQAWAPASEDSVPRLPPDLLEVVHSAPLDLAAGEEVEDVERTVVGYPPPPPSLPENYESAAHTVNRAELEAAVVAAMNNLAQLEEEDMTLVMQRLPPQSKATSPRTRTGETRLPEFVTRSRTPKPELEAEADASLEAGADLEAAEELEAAAAAEAYAEPAVEEPAPESKLRINRAPRPVAKPTPVPPVAKGAATSKASAPSSTAKPAAAKPASPVGPARAGGTGRGSAPTGAAPARASASKPASMASKPAAAPARASAPAGAGKPASAPAGASRSTATPSRVSASKPASAASKPATAPARAGAPTGASKPAPGASKPTPGASKPAAAPVRTSASSKPAAAPARAGAPSKPAPSAVPPPGGVRPSAGLATRPSLAPGSARPPAEAAQKPTRPDNPLAERLRRRAGLQKPDAAPGRPTEPRATEPIIVRSPSSLPPKHKK